MPRNFLLYADGGSRGNPGEAAFGAVISEDGKVVVELSERIGVATNNVAEYNGLLAGLIKAYDIDPGALVHVRMDSKLVVEQMSGRWKIKHPDMAVLAAKAKDVIGNRAVTYEWVPRLQNALADAAANKSMDLRESFEA